MTLIRIKFGSLFATALILVGWCSTTLPAEDNSENANIVIINGQRIVLGNNESVVIDGPSVTVNGKSVVAEGGRAMLVGSGAPASEDRDTHEFGSISVTGSIHLEATAGRAPGISVTADDNILPHVKTKLWHGRLYVYVDEPYSTTLGVVVKVTAPAIQSFSGSGSTESNLTNLRSRRFRLTLNGSSVCKLSGGFESLSAKLEGSSVAKFAGKAETISMACSGSSKFDAIKLRTRAVKAELEGSSSTGVFASDEIDVKASGSSQFRFAGRPAHLTKQLEGSSEVVAE